MNTNDSEQRQGSSRRIIEKELSHAIVGCFFDVYNELGYGFMESLYARALEITMQSHGLRVDREYPVTVRFRGQQIGFHRIDMLVDRRVVVEIKSSERVPESARRQLRSYVITAAVNKAVAVFVSFAGFVSFVFSFMAPAC